MPRGVGPCGVVRRLRAEVAVSLQRTPDWRVRVSGALAGVTDGGDDRRWATPPCTWGSLVEIRASQLATGFLLDSAGHFDVRYAADNAERTWAEWLSKRVVDDPAWVDRLGIYDGEILERWPAPALPRRRGFVEVRANDRS